MFPYPTVIKLRVTTAEAAHDPTCTYKSRQTLVVWQQDVPNADLQNLNEQ